MKHLKNHALFLVALVVLILASTSIAKQAPQAAVPAQPSPAAPGGAQGAPADQPEEPGIAIANVIQTNSGVTVKTAADWADTYADIYASYLKNSENKDVVDHVEEYPMIEVLYEGMAFNKFYNSARGHIYSVEDLSTTGRPHALANCFTCKTPDFTNAVNEQGVGVYTMAFEDMLAQVNEPISCFNCHANDPTGITITHTYLSDALGAELATVDAATLSCAQCHVEYYFAPETKATTLPYSGRESMHPDAIFNYYETLLVEGQPFADYTNPRSGVRQIKVQHPEFETFMGAGSVHAGTFTCADCHMEQATAANGNTYPSHYWVSPLEIPALQESTCSACHEDLTTHVRGIQEKAEARTNTIGFRLEEIMERLVVAVESGDYTEEELGAMRQLMREAQFYWDFVMVENSEGAHNSRLTHECLDKSERLAGELEALFK